MTVSTTLNRKLYNGNGSTTSFAYPFRILAEGDIIVTVDDVVQTLTTHYTLTGVGDDAGGDVVFVTAPPSGTSNVVFDRSIPYTQLIDLINQGPFNSEVIEAALDKLTFLVQQLLDFTDRVPSLPATTVLSALSLPEPGASQYIRWNTAGTALEAVTLSTSVLAVSSFIETLLDDASAALARVTLDCAQEGSSVAAITTLADADTLSVHDGAEKKITAANAKVYFVDAGWQLVQAQNGSAVANIDFTTGFDAGYDHMFTWQGIYPASGASLVCKVKEGGSWVGAGGGGTEYRASQHLTDNGAVSLSSAQFGYGIIGVPTMAASAGEASDGELISLDPASATYQTAWKASAMCGATTGAARFVHGNASCQREAAAACQGFQFIWASGVNFAASGVIKHFRRKVA